MNRRNCLKLVAVAAAVPLSKHRRSLFSYMLTSM